MRGSPDPICFHGLPKSACSMCLTEAKLAEIGRPDLAKNVRSDFIQSERAALTTNKEKR